MNQLALATAAHSISRIVERRRTPAMFETVLVSPIAGLIAMYFRFGSALFLVVSISLLGIAIEKQNLALRRELSRQHYRMDVLQDRHVRLRLKSQRLSAIERLFATIEDEESGLVPAESPPGFPRKDKLPEQHVDPQPDSDRPQSSETGSVRRTSPKRRVPLLFWQKPVRDPRLEGSRR